MSKVKTKRVCKKCGDAKRCHSCGFHLDNRGWAKSWKNTKNGPTHYLCPSCNE